jgi:SnoaL-like domain
VGRTEAIPTLEDTMADTTTTPDVDETLAAVTATVDTYFAMLNEPDDARRAELADQAWDPAGVYVDPLGRFDGPAAIAQMVGAAQQQFPGHHFARTSGVDTHHRVVRFSWELAAGDGTVAVAGLDVGTLAADDRLTGIAGFFGPLPEQ